MKILFIRSLFCLFACIVLSLSVLTVFIIDMTLYSYHRLIPLFKAIVVSLLYFFPHFNSNIIVVQFSADVKSSFFSNREHLISIKRI
jgi:hypothetical protein